MTRTTTDQTNFGPLNELGKCDLIGNISGKGLSIDLLTVLPNGKVKVKYSHQGHEGIMAFDPNTSGSMSNNSGFHTFRRSPGTQLHSYQHETHRVEHLSGVIIHQDTVCLLSGDKNQKGKRFAIPLRQRFEEITAISHDGDKFAYVTKQFGCQTRTVWVRAVTGNRFKILHKMPFRDTEITQLEFDPSGDKLVIATKEPSIRIVKFNAQRDDTISQTIQIPERLGRELDLIYFGPDGSLYLAVVQPSHNGTAPDRASIIKISNLRQPD